jgi:hypothetical protein
MMDSSLMEDIPDTVELAQVVEGKERIQEHPH